MRFSNKLRLSLACLTLAAPALSSNVAQVETDLNNIQAATATWGSSVKSWGGDAASLPTITTAGNSLTAVVDSAVSDVKATYPFEEADAKAIIALVTNGVPVLTQATNNLIDKFPVFFNQGFNATSGVETVLTNLLLAFSSLADALKANTPTDLVSQVTDLQNQISNIFVYTIEAFDPD